MIPGMGKDAPAQPAPQVEAEKTGKSLNQDKKVEPEEKTAKRRGRPPKADKDKAAAPKPKAPAQKPEKAVKKEPEKKSSSNGTGRFRSEGTREAEGCTTPGQGADRLYQAERAPRLQEPSL